MGDGTLDWFQVEKGVRQGYMLSLCLFNLYTEYIMRNAGLYEAQAGIKFAERSINNLRYADNTPLMEKNEELKSLLYAGQEATVRTGHGKMGWFQVEKGVRQSCVLSPCLFNFYAEYIVWNDRLDEARVGIKITRRNISNLGYADDTTLMAESEEELKSLLMKVKEASEKAGLKLYLQETKIMASSPITSWQINGETMETVRVFSWASKSLQMVTEAIN